ncbi:MAG: SLC13 family permease, partial [Salinibacterium sp.]|nr:SLC13 family permease [Salinibacterium sp.]
VLSAFMNNTPLVLIFLPLFLGLAQRMDVAPSKLLIPLSFVSIMGGMCTKIGTSTNIVVSSALEGQLELGLFDFTPVGIILAVVGIAFLILLGDRFLPSRPSLGLSTSGGLAAEYMTELEIRPGSPVVGKSIGEAFPKNERQPGRERVRVLQLIHRDIIHPAQADMIIAKGDLLLIKGDPAAILGFTERDDTGVIPTINIEEEASTPAARRVAMSLVEVIVTPTSRFIDFQVSRVKFRERWGVSVFAVQRHGAHLRQKVDELRLKAGDILLVQGSAQSIQNLRVSESFLVVEGVQSSVPHTKRAPLAVLGLATFVGLAVCFPSQVHLAAMAAALLMIVGRCLTAAEAYAALDWDVLFLLGGTLALGASFERVGLAAAAADQVVGVCGPYGPNVAVAGIFVFTLLITQFLSNNAAAAIMTPLAYNAGLEFAAASGRVPEPHEAMPFVMAVAFGASCC